MKNDSRPKRWLLNITAFVILLPVFLYFILGTHKIAQELIYQSLTTHSYWQSLTTHSHWPVLPVIVLVLGLYVTSFILLLWKGRLRLAVLAAFLSFCVVVISVPVLMLMYDGSGLRRLGILKNTPGIDVFCNDVYLGETPLEISETEFHDKVKPWNTPPRQVIINQVIINDEWSIGAGHRIHTLAILANPELRRPYIPYEYFNKRLNFDRREFYGDLPISESQYWWRFERDGCVAIAVGQESIDIHEEGRPINSHSWALSLEYPSIRPYLKHLLHALKRSNYQPSTEWRTHVADASGLLFHHLYEIGLRDSRVMRALEMAIQREFGIHEEMSPEGWRAVLDEVISRSMQYKNFHTLSPESVAMDLVIQHNPKLIETRFLKLLSRIMNPWRVFTSGLNRSTTYRDPAEFFPLEYAVLKSRPPALFERLVYESGRGERFLSMVGNYSRAEAGELVRHYLNEAPNGRLTMYQGVHYKPRRRALDFATHLHNPALELELRRFVLQHAQQDSGSADHYLREFIKTRLERHLTEDDAIALAEWIAETVPLLEGEKLRYLAFA